MKVIPVIFRWVIGVALLCGVYTETGVFTTIVLFLVFIGSEIEKAVESLYRNG